MYAILNKQEDGIDCFFGIEYGPADEPGKGYEAAVFAAGFKTIEQMDKFALKKNIHLWP